MVHPGTRQCHAQVPTDLACAEAPSTGSGPWGKTYSPTLRVLCFSGVGKANCMEHKKMEKSYKKRDKQRRV